MKRRILLLLLILLLIIGLPMSLLVREFRREQASRDLIAAVYDNDTEKALSALKMGADPNARNPVDVKPRPFLEHMKQLCDNLLHPHARPEPDTRETALLLHLKFVHQDNPTLVRALLDASADPNLMGDANSDSPIMWAAMGNHPQSLRLLLQHGGNPRWKDKFLGRTALMYAVMNGNAEEIRLLLDAGADREERHEEGKSLLHLACEYNHPEAIKALLQCHANPNLRARNGTTPLDEAVRRENTQIIKLLRKAGAKTSQELDAETKRSVGGK